MNKSICILKSAEKENCQLECYEFLQEQQGEVFLAITDLGDITGAARINFMWWDAGPRVLKVTSLYSYVTDANGNKGASTSPFGVDSLTKFVEVDA